MPKRDDRSFEERRQQIIDGALKAFSELGFEQATNRDIAAAAGIGSPGLIYHYFKDKETLFREVIEQRVPLLQLIAHPDEILTLSPAEALTRIGRAYLSMADRPETTTLLKLIIAEGTRRPAVARLFGEVGPTRALQFLAVCFQHWMRQGLLRPADPAIAARCFMSPLIVFLLSRVILQMPDALEMDTEHLLQTTIEIVLRGLRPDS